MTLFDLVGSKDNAALGEAIGRDPLAAAARNAEGASLLAFAAYVGNAEAVTAIRAALPRIDAYEAIIIGDVERLKAAIEEGWDGNGLSPDGFTPLALAAFFSRKEGFDLLLPVTRDVNQRASNAQQVAALHAAAAVRAVPAVEKLLRAGADPNLTQQQGFVALHTAAIHGDALMAGLLLLFGADPARRDAGGKSAADHARAGGHDWLAERLEKSDARSADTAAPSPEPPATPAGPAAP
ncbi:MAG: ankyrin repeat domain-containing protein [Devosia sp.]|nr:ankyrin repeat domain-containing protein [Devosia sp.]